MGGGNERNQTSQINPINQDGKCHFSTTSQGLFAGLNWKDYVDVDPRYLRPLEVEFLQGDASKAERKLGWKPKIRFKEVARIMVDSDMKDLEEMRRCQDVIRKLSTANSKQ